MAAANCKTCGAPVHYHGTDRGVKTNKETGERMRSWPARRPGWVHSQIMGQDSPGRSDHPIEPHDDRSPEADMTRQTGQWDQAQAHVGSTLQKGFDHLHAENTVNDIFRDRRAT